MKPDAQTTQPSESWTARQVASALRRASRRVDLGPLDAHSPDPDAQPLRIAALPGVAAVGLRVARLLHRLEHPQAAAQVLARSNSHTSDGLIALGNLALEAGRRAVTASPRVGTRSRFVGDPIRGRQHFEAAAELDPARLEPWIGLVRCHSLLGDDKARRQAATNARRIAPKNVTLALHESAAIRLTGKRRGAMLQDEAATVRTNLERLLRSDPGRTDVRHQLVHGDIAVGEFDRAAETAWPGGPSLPTSWADGECERAAAGPEAPDLWCLALHARELHSGRILSAYASKTALAERIAARGLRPAASYAELDIHARATAYLGMPRRASAELRRRLRWWNDETERLAARKFSADVDLLHGDPSSLINFSREVLSPSVPELEDAFRKLVTSKRVAVVGPAPCDLEADLQDFDTVITTKQLAPWTRSKADVISYYSDASAVLDSSTILELLDDKQLAVAVVRQSLLPALDAMPRLRGRFRVMPTEDGTTFFSTRFGLQRILYDVVKYRPRDLAVFGTDLFSGAQQYAGDYANEVERLYEPGGFETSVSMSVHDYLADFEFTRSLHQSGLISVSPHLVTLLDGGATKYLHLLDDGRSTRQSD